MERVRPEEKDSVRHIEITYLDDTVVNEFELVNKGKVHFINIVCKVGDNVCEEVLTENHIDAKNTIVYCSLLADDEHIIELTEIVRKFVKHFNLDDNVSRLEHLFKYIEKRHNVTVHPSHKLLLYMNDNDFTERVFTVGEIGHLTYKDIMS